MYSTRQEFEETLIRLKQNHVYLTPLGKAVLRGKILIRKSEKEADEKGLILPMIPKKERFDLAVKPLIPS